MGHHVPKQALRLEESKQRALLERLKTAYAKLCANLDVDGVTLFARDDPTQVFLTQGPIKEGSSKWSGKVIRNKVNLTKVPTRPNAGLGRGDFQVQTGHDTHKRSKCAQSHRIFHWRGLL